MNIIEQKGFLSSQWIALANAPKSPGVERKPALKFKSGVNKSYTLNSYFMCKLVKPLIFLSWHRYCRNNIEPSLLRAGFL
jgi:hypothetical protein